MSGKNKDSKSSVKLSEVKKKKEDDEENIEAPKEKFVPKNWNNFKKDTKKMSSVQKSKWMMYEEPPKEVAEQQAAIRKRLLDRKKELQVVNAPMSRDQVTEKDKHEKLIGQLKAAEARNRLRIMRLRYQANRAQEVNHLISCQPSALKAVRLQALVPPHPERTDTGDILDKLQRSRVESLLEDNTGLLTNRIA